MAQALATSAHHAPSGAGRPRKFTREGVLEKAFPVFWALGYGRTRLPDLEAATGVNRSGLYAEFRSIDELFVECLRFYVSGWKGRHILAREPLGWDNIQLALETAPSLTDRRGCFVVNTMRELEIVPDGARAILELARLEQAAALEANIVAENPRIPIEDLREMIITFTSGCCIEANRDADLGRTLAKISSFMGLLRAM